MKPEHANRGHSKLAPSKAHTWTVCTASVPFLDSLIAQGKLSEERKSSKYADEGTQAHEVCEALLRGERPPRDTPSVMLDHCKGYVRFCKSLTPEGALEYIEYAAPLFYLPGDTGHCDYVTYDQKGKQLHVVDFKYGAGVSVSAERNKQLAIYARSALAGLSRQPPGSAIEEKHWRSHTIHVHIYQPRSQEARDEGVVVKSASYTWDELNLFCEKEIAVPAALILDKDAHHLLQFRPGPDTCKWCPAADAGLCNARAQWLLNGTPVQKFLSGELLSLDANATQDEDLVEILRREKDIRDYLDAVKKSLWTRAREGNPVPGTKLVAGRGSRTWTEGAEKHVAALLGDAAYEAPVLVSPSKAEGAADKETKKALQEFIEKTPGAPIISLAESSKAEWVDPSRQFENLDIADAIADAV